MPGVKVVIQRASIAQMVERKTLNLVVVGSSPTSGVFSHRLPNIREARPSFFFFSLAIQTRPDFCLEGEYSFFFVGWTVSSNKVTSCEKNRKEK